MAIWYLLLWSAAVAPFEGGQYQNYEMCHEAAQVQVAVLRRAYGTLKWRCELRVG
jgi:hypothetical protein